jgi:hypothetical protein
LVAYLIVERERLDHGVTWRIRISKFIRDYFAIDTSLFFALATDDLFPNGSNDLDFYDIGIRLGIRVNFK